MIRLAGHDHAHPRGEIQSLQAGGALEPLTLVARDAGPEYPFACGSHEDRL